VANKEKELFERLDYYVLHKRLAELHTHIMGMGSANFWVNKVIQKYIPLKEKDSIKNGSNKAVIYPLVDLLKANGIILKGDLGDFYNKVEFSRLESRLFDSISGVNFQKIIDENREKFPGRADYEFISNSKLIELLGKDALSTNSGHLMSFIRNSFQFLSNSGADPTRFDNHTCLYITAS
jgi:hypothetical protein